MENIFISNLTIVNVRHLKNITIPLSDEKLKHLIFTGKNGSGKTSVLEVMSHYLGVFTRHPALLHEFMVELKHCQAMLNRQQDSGEENSEAAVIRENIDRIRKNIAEYGKGVILEFNQPVSTIAQCFDQGRFIMAYYKAERIFAAEVPQHVEKIELKDQYSMTETPRQVFVKYLLDLKVTEALARTSGKCGKADAIRQWFDNLQELLRRIFDDPSLELLFEEDTFSFTIKEQNKEVFDFNTLSSGFAAVLDVVLDIIIRMEKQTNRSFDFSIPGIVLIDEIETHLHLELQKTILELLTTIFPNIQFIMSTHSPFILNSISNVVIYDMEKNIIVKDGLADIPYGGIVEGYFQSDELSASLKKKFERYKRLVSQQTLSDDDFEEIAELEMFLNEIPDYLALNITTEYQRLKMAFESREDI